MKEITKEFCIVRVKRTIHGLSVFCKSEKIESFFKNLSEQQNAGIGEGNEKPYTGMRYYKLLYFPDIGFKINLWGNGEIWHDVNKANLSFLRTVGISDGITYPINGVFSLDSIQKWIEATKTHLQRFYAQYMKPINIEFIVSTREEIL